MSGQASVDTWLAENYPSVMTVSPGEADLLDTVRRLGDEADHLVTERDQARAVADALGCELIDAIAEADNLRTERDGAHIECAELRDQLEGERAANVALLAALRTARRTDAP